MSDNSHKEGEQLNEQNHKEREHEIEVNKEIKMHELDLQHDEKIRRCKMDKEHEYRLECLKTFKELLLKDPNHKIENLKEVMKFLNDIAPQLDFGKSKRKPQDNSIPSVSHMEYGSVETDGVDMIDGPAIVDFGAAPSLTKDEREVMKLLGSFIKSAQDSLQQQQMGIPNLK